MSDHPSEDFDDIQSVRPRHLPVVQPARPSAATSSARAAFISQLIAEHQHLPPQRERRRATVAVAVGAYGDAQRQAIRRLPPGYRKTLTA